jgi:hypothetical protein
VNANGKLVGSHISGTVAHQQDRFYAGIKAALGS